MWCLSLLTFWATCANDVILVGSSSSSGYSSYLNDNSSKNDGSGLSNLLLFLTNTSRYLLKYPFTWLTPKSAYSKLSSMT